MADFFYKDKIYNSDDTVEISLNEMMNLVKVIVWNAQDYEIEEDNMDNIGEHVGVAAFSIVQTQKERLSMNQEYDKRKGVIFY